MKSGRRSKRQGRGGLRIIGGEWRGRRLPVTERPGLRPTADRVRETLFNWLQGTIADARCLDLFAGSGALGLEALSRGARECVFVDHDRRAAGALRDRLRDLAAGDRARCLQSTAARFLAGEHAAFDIIFLDPPFAADLLPATCASLDASGLCHPETLIYVETDAPAPGRLLPASWHAYREASGGAVRFGLYRQAPFVGPR